MGFSPSHDIIDALKKRIGLDEKIYTVLQVWEKELGPLAAHARLVGIKMGQVVVEVTSSVHFQELNLRKRSLIHQLNQYFGGEKVVKNIRLQIKK